MSKLFSPARIGPYTLAHRVVLAPITRLRSDQIDYTGTTIAAGGFDGSEAERVVSEGTRILLRSRGGFRPIPICPNVCAMAGL